MVEVPRGVVQVSEGESGNADLTFAVKLSKASVTDTTVDYATSDGTATGADYIPATGTLTIPAGQTEVLVHVAAIGDTAVEGDEHLFLTLTNVSANARPGNTTARLLSWDSRALARVTTSPSRAMTLGTLDASFGAGGKASVDFSGSVDKAWAVLIQTDGSIVVAGHANNNSPGGDNDFAAVRFTPSGMLDMSFGTGGKVSTNIAGRIDLASAAALQADGKIVLAGRVADGGGDDPDYALIRYNADGSLDGGFGTSGIVWSIWSWAARIS